VSGDARPNEQESSTLSTLADQLGELSLTLQQQTGLQDTLDAIVEAARDIVPGVQHASLSSVTGRHKVTTRAATSELARQIDDAQYSTQQGPCLSTLYDQRTAYLPDMAADERWPAFSIRALQLGIGSMLAVQLFVHGEDLGALNLSNTQTHAFDDESEHVALLLANHAAVAMVGAQEQHRLRQAVSSREVLGQATGVLIERYRTTPEAAFMLLVRASQHSNRKLRDIAEELVRSGALPG
jgi:GAF domain-containing protein